MKPAKLITVLVAVALNCHSQEWLDRIEDRLSLKTPQGLFQADLSVLLDLEGYYIDQRAPGLLLADQSFINPRATFFLDTKLGTHFYAFLQARLDRGFDAGAQDFDARLDEYFLRWTPLQNQSLNLQIGKFATAMGNWVERHDSWQNPLITAPLPYENLTIVSDEHPPSSPQDFLARRGMPDQKDEWLPVIWGPVYTSGGSLFGSIGKFDYTFEVKNAAISSHPYLWDLTENEWRYATFTGRLGFRPNPAWTHGLSLSYGPYLSAEAEENLAPGVSLSDFNQITLNYNVSYAWRHWQFWAELFLTRFEVPNVGNADLLAYYFEAKYKITPQLYAAVRWNQEIFGTVHDGAGGWQTWDDNMLRVDLALGYRFTRHFQTKIQYSFAHRDSSLQQGEQLAAAQVTVRF